MNKAFTLVEILLAMLILGVVAVMTIPALLAYNKEKGWNISSLMFERRMEEALQIMNTQSTLAGYTTTKAFVNELSKNMKLSKVCKNDNLDNCFPKNFKWGNENLQDLDITTFTDSSHLKENPFGTETMGVVFVSGVSAILAYNPECTQNPFSNDVPVLDCISVLYDVSGFTSPNQSGKDIKAINVDKLPEVENYKAIY